MKSARAALSLLLFAFLFATCSRVCAQTWDKFNIGAGAGFTSPTGRTSNDVNTGWNFGLRGGYNITPHIGADLDFSYDYWGLNSAALARYKEPGGNMSIWSVTLNPVVRIAPRRRVDPYWTAGFGVYHRNLTLTAPALVNTIFCDYFFGYCFPATVGVNQVVASATTYKGGWNAGGGFEVRLGEGRMKIFAEARYQNMFTTHGSDLGYIPVTFGLRW